MVERRVCTFCGIEIEPGTGRMYIKKDGIVYNFCTSKCFKNMIILGRVPRRTTWTQYYAREKQIRMKGLPTVEAAPKARKVKKAEEKPKEEAKEPEKKPEEKAAAKAEKPKAEEKKPEEKAPAKKAPAKKSEPTKKAEKPKAKAEHKPKEGEKS
jgi:large subunit ribosomal protein L24e